MRADRFILIVSDEPSSSAQGTLEEYGFATTWTGPTSTLMSDPRMDRITFGADGVLLGTLFDRSARAPLEDLDGAATTEVIQSDGAALTARYWGNYVACFERGGVTHVVRDPSGQLPCYWYESDAGLVVTSDLATCVEARLLAATIDWTAIAGHLLHFERRARQTALAGVRELMPGERLTIGPGCAATIMPLWQPWSFTRRDQLITDDAEAVELVRRAVLNSVGAWGRCCERPLLSLSGGLDSSIIAVALAPSRPTCVTIATSDAGGDERAYAKLVADRIEAPLVERSFELDQIDLHRSAAARLPRPVARLFVQEVDRAWRETINATCGDALFHGGGGDNVFCYLTSPAPALDSFLVNGLDHVTRRAVADVAMLTDSSILTVVRTAARKILADHGRYRWNIEREGLSAKAIALGREARHHPWFEAMPRGVLPGKQAHVAAIVRIQNHIDAAEPSRIVPVIAPLLSQPIMETCLRVPTWMWSQGGISRSVARRAFAADLPVEIAERRGKGSPDAFDATITQTHRSAIADMLLGGALARAGLIDVGWVRSALSGQGPITGTAYLRVAMFVDVEAWLQSWAAMGADVSGAGDARA